MEHSSLKTLPSRILVIAALLLLGVASTESRAAGSDPDANLGKVRNEVAKTLVPGTRYDNIVNVGCGWASGVNFVSSYDRSSVLPQVLANPSDVFNTLTDPAT